MGKAARFAGKGEGKRRSAVPDHYRYLDTRTGLELDISLDQLKAYGEELPIKCQKALASGVRLTGEVYRDLLLLHDLSSQIWSYGMRGKLNEINIKEYRSEYYVHMIKYLMRFDRSKGCWVAQARFAGYDTNHCFMRQILGPKKAEEAMASFMAQAAQMSPEHFDPLTGLPI
jgi:hypothetical protein